MSNTNSEKVVKWFGLDGAEITSDDWSRLFRMKRRNVAADRVRGFEVQTIWEGRGVKIPFVGDVPQVYNTVVWIDGTRVAVGSWWWQNRAEAVAGHARIVQALASGDYGPDSVDLNEQIS